MTIEITKEYEEVFNCIKNNISPIFVTGGAGSGKTSLIKKIKNKYKELNVIVVAPTGIAALNVSGSTIHSVFKIPPKFITHYDKQELKYIDMLRKVDILIIDEVSMVNANLFDTMNYVMQISCGNSKFFGGKTVLCVGDLYQLPPVVTFQTATLFEKTYKTPYFFSANCMDDITLKTIHLKTIFRQKDDEFIELLSNIRQGNNIEETIEYLNTVVDIKEKVPKDSIYITTTNDKCQKINDFFIKKLSGEMKFFDAKITGKFPTTIYPVNTIIGIKMGAQVMCIKNQGEGNAVNGTIGKVKWIGNNSVIITDIKTGREHQINKCTWENHRYKASGQSVVSDVTGTFTQIPLKLAWAITIHKSQGQTINKLHIDMDSGSFASGQLYVALSRCTSLEGLSFSRKLLVSDVIIDPTVKLFYENE